MADAEAAKYFAEGETCIRRGLIKEGIEAFRAGLNIDPENPDGWYNLGYLLRTDREFVAAVTAYEEALRRGAKGAQEVYLNIAVIEADYLNRPERAVETLNKALLIDPAFVPALLNLGNAYEELGNGYAALAAYREVLKHVPSNGRALGRMAMVSLELGDAAASVDQLTHALPSARAPEDRAEIAFALGQVLDQAGDYRQAFQAFTVANAAARQFMPVGERYDAARQSRRVTDLLEFGTIPKLPLTAFEGPSPIFIVGMFRSGSTLVEQIIGRHSQVMAGGELEFIPATVRRQFEPFPASMASLKSERARALRSEYLTELALAGLSGPRITDKRPDNVLYLPLITAIFPDAPLILTKRNAADTALSVFFGNFGPGVPYACDLSDIAHWSLQFDRLRRHWLNVYNGQVAECDYDALVENPQSVTRSLLEHCDLPWEDACLTASATQSPVRTLSNWQVRQPIHKRSVQRWRNYAPFLPDSIKRLQDI